MTASMAFDANSNGKVNDGDSIKYSTTISNTGTADATAVHFSSAIDPSTTWDGTYVISPLAANDTYSTVGNMTLDTTTLTNCATNALYSVTCNDSLNGAGVNSFGDSQAHAGNTPANGSNSVMTTHGGSVVLNNSNGTFTYTPAAGFSGSDSFWYTLANTSVTPNLTDTAQVTITVGGANGMVWFISPGGTGSGTQASPKSLLSANPSAPGDTIFLLSGTHAGQLTLLANQKLIGQATTATVAALGGPAPKTGNSYPPSGGAVTISAGGFGSNDVVLSTDNVIAGFTAGDATGPAITGGAVNTLKVREVAINNTGGGGALAITTSGVITASSPDPMFTGFTSTSATGGSNGVVLAGVSGTINLGTGSPNGLNNASGSEFSVSGGSAAITYSGSMVHTSAAPTVAITGGTSSVTFGGTISTNTGATVSISGGHSGGTIAFNNTVTASSGTGLQFNGAFGVYSFGTVTLSGGAGIDISGGSGGTLSFGSGSSIGNRSSAAAFTISGSNNTPVVLYQGTISQGSAQPAVSIAGVTGGSTVGIAAPYSILFSNNITKNGTAATGISISGNSAGTIGFTGPTISLSTSTSNGIDINNSTGGGPSVTFAPISSLGITTTSGTGFSASNSSLSGTVVVTGSSNTIASTSGTALSITNTAIGASHLTFQSISSGSASDSSATGIILDTTGSNGGLHVTGVGPTAASGGTIQHKTGSDGSTSSGVGIYLNSTSGVQLAYMQLNDFQNFAIRGTSVTVFTLDHSVVNSTGGGWNGSNATGGIEESSISFDGLFGSATISNSSISGGFTDNIRVVNTSGTLNRLVMDTLTLGAVQNGAAVDGTQDLGDDSVHLEATGTATMNVTFQGNTETSARGDLFNLNNNGTGSVDLTFNNNHLSNNYIRIATGGGGVSMGTNGTGDFTYSITNSTFRDAVGQGLLMVHASAGNASMIGTISGNTIGVNGVSNSGSLEGDALKLQLVGRVGAPGGTMKTTLTGNTIQQYNNFGIDMLLGGGAPGIHQGTYEAIITGNTVGPLGTNTSAAQAQGIALNGGTNVGDIFDIYLELGGTGTDKNDVTNWTATNGQPDVRIRQRQSTTVHLTAQNGGGTNNYAGGNTDTTAVATFISANNTTTGHVSATASGSGGGFVGGAPPLLLAMGGVEPILTAPVAPLEAPQIEAVAAAAARRWSAAGVSGDQLAMLRTIRFNVTQLVGLRLGESVADVVRLDAAAAGKPWFVDPYPLSDTSFPHVVASTRRYADANGPAAGRVDLLTATLHEMGHRLGLADSYAANDRDSLMYGYLTAGERRLPAASLLAALSYRSMELRRSLSLWRQPDQPIRHWASVPAAVASAPSAPGAIRANDPRDSIAALMRALARGAAGAVADLLRSAGFLARAAIGGLNTPLEAFSSSVEIDLGTLPVGKSITVVYIVTAPVNQLPLAQYSAKVTITGSNFTSVDSNTATISGDRWSSSTSVSSGKNPADAGDSVTFTATVHPTQGPGTPRPTGSVSFAFGDGSAAVVATCNTPVNNDCTAQATHAFDTGNTYSVVASYQGDNYAPSTSSAFSQTINACTNNPVVTSNADNGAGSLRQALVDACGSVSHNTITFNMGSVVSPITLTSGELAVNKSVVISGPGAKSLTITRDGTAGNFRLLHLATTKTLTVSGVTLTNGLVSDPGSSGWDNYGGAIFGEDATQITVTSVAINGNTATYGAAISTRSLGGGVALTISNSTISGNTSGSDGAVNVLTSAGTGTLTMTNSTVSGNHSSNTSAGIALDGSVTGTITNATIANNDTTAPFVAAGVRVGGAATLTLNNTIVSGNTSGTGPQLGPADVDGALDPLSSHNLIGDGTLMTGVSNGSNGNIVGANPLLGPLADNGGQTQTQALLQGSPAIDAGDDTAATNASLTTDQRGTGFGRFKDGPDADATPTVDIGAFEVDPSLSPIADQATLEDVPVGVSFNVGDSTTGSFSAIGATSNNQTLAPNANLVISGSGSTRTLTITPGTNASGTATITVSVSKVLAGNTYTASDTFNLSVAPVAHTPAVTGATTLVGTQTTSGLVITRNNVDGGVVDHFRITNIVNGLLFKNDGVTPIASGDYIAIAEGTAGLKFTPTNHANAGSFDVQATIGLSTVNSSPVATPAITVNKFNSATTIQTHLPDPAYETQPITVTYTVTSTNGGPTPTGNVSVTMNDGAEESCTGTVAAAQCTLALTSAGTGTRLMTAHYAGDPDSNASDSASVSQGVQACSGNPVVTTSADSGAGSLRQAIIDACPNPEGNTITFDMNHVTSPITLTSGELAPTNNVVISGPGAKQLTIMRDPSAGHFRIFHAATDRSLSISGVTIANGVADTDLGGGIYGQRTTIALSEVVVTGNTAQGGGGIAVRDDNGDSFLTIDRSLLSGNTTSLYDGGGLFIWWAGGSGAAHLTMNNSTISGNQAATYGAGLSFTPGAAVSLTNVTVANNVNNSGAGQGAGLNVYAGAQAALLNNTIVAGNTNNGGQDVGGSVDASSSHNLIGNGGGLSGISNGVIGNLVGVDPVLGPLQDNGGATHTHALLFGSPAIDAGDNTVVVGTVDQRGTGFPRIAQGPSGNATVDIGAYEADPTISAITNQVMLEDAPLPLAVPFTVGDSTTGSFDSIVATSTNQPLVANGNLVIIGSGSTRTLTIMPNALQFGTTTITVTVYKTVGGVPMTASEAFLLTVLPVAHTPSVSPASTKAQVQTTSGLVITRNAADIAAAVFFKITNIQNGTLFLFDGVTQIGPGSFIDVASAGVGLKFTPANGFVGTASFNVRASLTADDSGLGGGVVPATITVSQHATSTNISGVVPEPSFRTLPYTVSVAVQSADGGPQPTGSVDITDGTSHCPAALDGGGNGSCQLTSNTAGPLTLTATYNGDVLSATSFITTLHGVTDCTTNPVVTLTDDSGTGTLRDAIGNACPGSAITFSLGAGPHTITLSSAIAFDRDLTIVGPPNNSLTLRVSTADRIFGIPVHTTVSLSNLTFTQGNAPDPGGAIASSGDLTIANSTFTLNSGNTSGSGFGGGAIFSDGNLTITSSTFSNNQTAGMGGGAIANHGTASITGSVFTGNQTSFGEGGAIDSEGNSLTVVGSTFSGNIAFFSGGAIFSFSDMSIAGSTFTGNQAQNGDGGAIDSEVGVVTIFNSTISGNLAAGNGGGLLNCGTTQGALVNDTITLNYASSGGVGAGNGGGLADTSTNPIKLIVNNSIVAGNFAGPVATPASDSPDDVFEDTGNGALIDPSSLNNLIGVNVNLSSLTNGVNGNQIGTLAAPLDPMLGPLQNNGGPTQTMALAPGSPALDAGDNAAAAGLTTDQRGVPRVVDSADPDTTATVDIGAYEAYPSLPVITGQVTDENVPLHLTFNVGGGVPITFSFASTNTTLVPIANIAVQQNGFTADLTVTPAPYGNGAATITITGSANAPGFGTAMESTTFPVTVNFVNQPPTLDPIANLTILENGGPQLVNLSGITAGLGGESQPLTVTATSDNHAVIPDPTVLYTSPQATGAVSFAPLQNANGAAHITVTVSDGSLTVQRTFTVTVTPVDQPPTITAIGPQLIAANSATGPIPFTIADVDTPIGSLTLSAGSSNPTLVPLSGIVFNGSGASRTVTITPALLHSGASTITIMVSDGQLTASSAFTLTVTPGVPPTITTQPLSHSIPPGTTASLSVAAIGTLPFSYQWYAGTTGNTSSPIAGATNSTFTTPALSLTANYWVRVSNGFGTPADSNTAVITIQHRVLTIDAALIFGSVADGTTKPLLMTLGNSGDGALTVTGISYPAGFTGPFSGTIPAGQTVLVVVTFAPTAVQTYGGTVTITANQTSGQTTTPISGTGTGPAPVITAHPTNVSTYPGLTATFTAAAVGNPLPTAQWQVSTDGGTTWTDIAGAASPFYSFMPTLADSGKRYRAVFTNSAGSATTDAATLTVTRRTHADLDGDGIADLVTWSPATGTWHWLLSSKGYVDDGTGTKQWGNAALGDVPLLGDVDGDGKADLIVWRASTGTFYWLTAASGFSYASMGAKQWGNAALGDVPLVADLDGDGLSELIVWRASTGTWYWLTGASGYNYNAAGGKQWGNASLGDVPLTGDVDSDGADDLIVWRASTGTWYWLPSLSGFNYENASGRQWGNTALGDQPRVGDIDGDGKADLIIWRPTDGTWYWLTSSTGYNYLAAGSKQWGNAALGDVPSIADLDGTGRASLMIWRASTATYYWLTPSSGYSYQAARGKTWGSPTDIPMSK